MRLLGLTVLLSAMLVGRPRLAGAQDWDSPRVASLVARATARRGLAEASDGLQRWQAAAHGMVLFLTQVGDAGSAPRLVKADELAVEVYWEAPGLSKQTIVAWRDRAWLPTDIRYHRDHLGIVANDFGSQIRLGEGDEVRDVPHPLSDLGASAYHFALVDSVTVSSRDREWQVFAVRVRPRNPELPAVLGTLYLDRESAALVRFQFSFTAAAYREATLEDITVVLENALQAGGFWLPWRQEIEIRRTSSFVELPVRGIIQGRWELSDFRLGADVSPAPAVAAEIGGLTSPGGPPDAWPFPLEESVDQALRPGDERDFETLRQTLWRDLPRRFRHLDPPVRPAFGGISEVVRFNRVEGVRVGAGAAWRLPWGGVAAVPWLGVALTSGRLSGRVRLGLDLDPHAAVQLRLGRETVDVGQTPIISPLLNSVLAQEFGADRGDWSERSYLSAQVDRDRPGGVRLQLGVTVESWRSLAVNVRPARGSFRPNPALAEPARWSMHGRVSRTAPVDAPWGVGWELGVEQGIGSGAYLRLLANGEAQATGDGGVFRVSGSGGWGSDALPATRGFVFGGWGTLPGTPFRAFGGRRFALGRVEWLARVRLPEVALGSFPPARPDLLIGPFLAAGVAGGPLVGTPWRETRGVRPVVGLAAEGAFGVLRLELGLDLRRGRWGLQGDVTAPWWGIL